VVFAAGRKENVVLADSLVFPNHQVSNPNPSLVCSSREERLSMNSPLLDFKRVLLTEEHSCGIIGYRDHHASEINVREPLALPLLEHFFPKRPIK
jgi:hypothetical protein